MLKAIIWKYIGRDIVNYIPDYNDIRAYKPPIRIVSGTKIISSSYYRENPIWRFDGSFVNTPIVHYLPFHYFMKHKEFDKKFLKGNAKTIQRYFPSVRVDELEPCVPSKIYMDTEKKIFTHDAGKTITEIMSENKLLAEEQRKDREAKFAERKANLLNNMFTTQSSLSGYRLNSTGS